MDWKEDPDSFGNQGATVGKVCDGLDGGCLGLGGDDIVVKRGQEKIGIFG